MESLLGFEEESVIDKRRERSSSCNRKLVPWLTWDEWLFVHRSLFSDSTDSIACALRRVSSWRSRGCVPVEVEVTASIIEIQLKDPFIKKGQGSDASLSEEMLAMLYCMAIMRLVNGVVEKTRKKTEVSIAVAADAIGLPRSLIDVRHEGSHRELPALQVVRSASEKALCWLKSYYWEPQKKEIPFQGDKCANIKREIESKLLELAFSLKVEEISQISSLLVKRKRGSEWHIGYNKFLSVASCKRQSPKTGGSKKQATKMLKTLVQLYSFFSTEVVSVLLEFLLKAISSSHLEELSECSHDIRRSTSTLLDDWKLIIIKLSSKEPDILLDLLNTVLDMFKTLEGTKYNIDQRKESDEMENLSSLFAWLAENLKELKTHVSGNSIILGKGHEKSRPKAALKELLRKCLYISIPGNKKLMDSATHIAQLIGEYLLMDKINKLSSLVSSNFHASEDKGSFMQQEDDSINKVAKKLELIIQKRRKSQLTKPTNSDMINSNRWVVAKSWTQCPIGMLPRSLGSSGCLPVLDYDVFGHDDNKVSELSEQKQVGEPYQCGDNREPSNDIQLVNNSNVDRMEETKEYCGSENEEDVISSEDVVEGKLMIGGVLKKVGKEELFAIESSIRIFA